MRYVLLGLAACGASTNPPHAAPRTEYLKGQLHVHTNNSGDSATPPARVASWYAEHGFDFIVLTDHNRISSLADPPPGLLVIPGVELTQNLDTCDPPPVDPRTGCLLHVNALFVAERQLVSIPPAESASRLALYTNALDETRALGGIAQLDHPNFHWGADAALIGDLAKRGLVLFEVANQSSDVANEGDAAHPSTEALWDAVLTAGGRIYGTATDDAHQYDDADAFRARGDVPDTGDRGWVMVDAPRDPAAIRDALARGDFYSSNGVVLRRIDRTADTLTIEAEGEADFAFIGDGGRVLGRAHGTTASIPITGTYVRATVTDARGRRAWVQP